MKTAHLLDSAVCGRLNRRGIPASLDDARTLRRAEKTLHRWAELECGDSNDYASLIADREAGALKRVTAICTALGVHFYHQTDPRGCALYVSADPMTDSNYSNGCHCSEG